MAILVRGLTVVIPICALLAPSPATALSEFVFASNFEAAPDCSSVGLTGCPGFAIETPALQIPAGEAVDACYYFRTPNSGASAIGRFSSVFDPAVAHFIFWATTDSITGLPSDAQAPGTFATDCGLTAGANGRDVRWVYAAHKPVEQLRMPDDDGAAQPLAFELPANSAGFLEIYYVNASGNAVTVPPVRLVANERSAGPYTRTASFLELNPLITVPSDDADHAVAAGCTIPASWKFWWFSTQTHSHSTGTQLSRNGSPATTIVTSSDWELPAIATFAAPGFFQFSSPFNDTLVYQCTFHNNTGATLIWGDDYQSREACMGISYFFPATQSKICIYDTVSP
jgi:hypothetical protein